MKTILKLRHNNASHPMLEGAEATVTAEGGAARCVHHGPGEWRFELPEGSAQVDVRLRARFVVTEKVRQPPHADPTEAAAYEDRAWTSAYDLAASYRVVEGVFVRDLSRAQASGGTSSLDARATVRSVAASGRGGHGAVVTIDVDLSFLDVTSVMDPDEAARIHFDDIDGCAVRIYQYTGVEGAARCRAVAVVIPTALRGGAAPSAVDSLLFFMPPSRGYGLAREASLFSLQRYLARRLGERLPFGFWSHPRGRPDEYDFFAWPPCRFASQLRDARRRVVLVMPLSNGSSYEPFHGAAWTRGEGHRPGALLDSLLAAIHADGHLAGGAYTPRVRRGRVGVGGFSQGSESASQCFRENADHVREFYLFDPNYFRRDDLTQKATVAWLAGDADRRVRLLGGMHHARLLDFHRRVAPHARSPEQVAVWPKDARFFHDSADYAAAHAREGTAQLTREGQIPEGEYSSATQLYLDPEASGDAPSFVARLANHQVSEPETLPGYSEAEAVTTITRVPPGGVFDARRLRDLFAALRRPSREGFTNADALRHQWTVFGGESDGAAHDGSFRGYLQICLDQSGFAR